MDSFARALMGWWDEHGRKDLPWQIDRSPYRVWISEVMLQQTQVATVIPYFERFTTRFPAVADLAAADLDEVLHLWTGLGYYARARNLHRAARQICDAHGGELPGTLATLTGLPGVGRSTAAAILSLSRDEPHPILDGNVKRVMARFHAVGGNPASSPVLKSLWSHAETHTPPTRAADYTQAIMDLGATVCVRRNPLCTSCPLANACAARKIDATDRYPAARPRRDKPQRAARMFLIVRPDGACLLERRPTSGIWGGLWTPPERSADTAGDDVCAEFGITRDAIAGEHTGRTWRHTFTHFHLDIEPVTVTVTQTDSIVLDDPETCWYQPGSNAVLGLSVPAVKLLSTLAEFELT